MFRDAEKSVRWLLLVFVLALLKFIAYVYDSDPQAFFGDSGSYLTTALIKWIPPDRSFLYGFLVRYLTINSHSLNSVVAFQTFAGIGTALMVAAMLTRYFQVRFRVASVVAIALALEPQHLMYERFILTETFSATVMAGALFLALEYLYRGRLGHLALFQLAGTLLIAFRVTFVPLVFVASVVLPAVRFIWNRSDTRWRQAGIEFAVSLLLLLGLHQAYKSWNGSLSEKPPAYHYADGFFLLSNVSPLVRPEDTDDPRIAELLRQPLIYGNHLEEWNSRNAEMFAGDGLVPRIQKAVKDDYRANLECKRIARRVIFRDPIGFLGLAADSYRKFFSRDYMKMVMEFEAAMQPLSTDELNLLARFHLSATELATHKTVTRKYYLAALPYYILLIHTPLILIASTIVGGSELRKFSVFLLLICSVHVAVVQVLGVEPSPRHNHAVAIFLAIAVGVMAERLARRAR
jgi:hypothetical protein